MSAKVVLKDKVLKSIERRHPWVFSGAVQAVKGHPEDGDILKCVSPKDEFLARGYWNGQSRIQVRVLSWEADELINEGFWRERLQQAINARGPLATAPNAACRLVNAESDYLPGLVVDRYGDWLVLQALTLGIDQRKDMLAGLLAELLQPRGILERSDVDIREKEGLPEATGLLYGKEPPELVEIVENDLRFQVDLYHGHKTGFYLDQRVNRARMRDFISGLPERKNFTVLNAFGYTGAFAVAALAGGAGRVISVDSSADVLNIAKANVALNGFEVEEEDFVQGDVFEVLRGYREAGTQFDLIILDPPKFARHAGQLDRATRGYKDINWLSFQLLKRDGYLWTFSCSNAVDADLFQKIVFGALIDAGRKAQIIQQLSAAPDHPVALTFPEGAYLKGLACHIR